MGTNIVVRAFYITKTKHYKYSRVLKLKSSEFCVEAVITNDLPKQCHDYKDQPAVETFCLTVFFFYPGRMQVATIKITGKFYLF